MLKQRRGEETENQHENRLEKKRRRRVATFGQKVLTTGNKYQRERNMEKERERKATIVFIKFNKI